MNNQTEMQRTAFFIETAPPVVMETDFLSYLEHSGYFTAPASTKYHGAYEGGLFDHSANVLLALEDLTERLGLKWGRPESPYIVAMFHDLCKIDNYTDFAFYTDCDIEYSNKPIISGHGDKSLIYLQKYVKLIDEEIACIRWHMGAFDDKENWNYYTKAVKAYPNVLWTHTADMVASQINGI